jgi:hypothetical protein
MRSAPSAEHPICLKNGIQSVRYLSGVDMSVGGGIVALYAAVAPARDRAASPLLAFCASTPTSPSVTSADAGKNASTARQIWWVSGKRQRMTTGGEYLRIGGLAGMTGKSMAAKEAGD